MTDEARNILVVAHARRPETVDAAARVIGALRDAGARPVLSADDRAELGTAIAGPLATLGADVAIAEIELATSREDAGNRVADGKYEEAKKVLGGAVKAANQQGAMLPDALAKDLAAAADEAEKMEANVDKAKADSKVRKEFSKGGKASSRAVKKK